MAVRITVMVLRVAALLALILGLLVWFGISLVPIGIHMLLGIIVTFSLWALGGLIFSTKGGQGLAIGAFVLGLLVVAVGLFQTQLLLYPSPHWIIQVIHLLLGLSAIGLGEAIAGRHRRANKAATAA